MHAHVQKNIIILSRPVGRVGCEVLRWQEAQDKNWYKCHSSRRKPVSLWMLFFRSNAVNVTMFYLIVNDHTDSTQSAKTHTRTLGINDITFTAPHLRIYQPSDFSSYMIFSSWNQTTTIVVTHVCSFYSCISR